MFSPIPISRSGCAPSNAGTISGSGLPEADAAEAKAFEAIGCEARVSSAFGMRRRYLA